MVEPLRHRQTKGAETDMSDLQKPRHISTLPFASFSSPARDVCLSSETHRENAPCGPATYGSYFLRDGSLGRWEHASVLGRYDLFGHVRWAPARSRLGSSDASSGLRKHNQGPPYHLRCAPPSLG